MSSTSVMLRKHGLIYFKISIDDTKHKDLMDIDKYLVFL